MNWEDLPPEGTTGDRRPFFPWRDCKDGNELRFRIDSDVEFDSTKFHGQHSLLEFDGTLSAPNGSGPLVTSTKYRFAVSGLRLAHALGKIRPVAGNMIGLTPTGMGVERTWTARRL